MFSPLSPLSFLEFLISKRQKKSYKDKVIFICLFFGFLLSRMSRCKQQLLVVLYVDDDHNKETIFFFFFIWFLNFDFEIIKKSQKRIMFCRYRCCCLGTRKGQNSGGGQWPLCHDDDDDKKRQIFLFLNLEKNLMNQTKVRKRQLVFCLWVFVSGLSGFEVHLDKWFNHLVIFGLIIRIPARQKDKKEMKNLLFWQEFYSKRNRGEKIITKENMVHGNRILKFSKFKFSIFQIFLLCDGIREKRC